MDREKEVERANQAFYRALESLDLAQMEAIWLEAPWVKCIHPGREVLVGWPKIRESWELIFKHTGTMEIAITQPSVKVLEEMGWVVCTENISSYLGQEVRSGLAQATNLFVHRNGRWLMVHHHASPIPLDIPIESGQVVQ